VACGADHTLVVTQARLLFVFGEEEDGQLGLGDRNDRNLRSSRDASAGSSSFMPLLALSTRMR